MFSLKRIICTILIKSVVFLGTASSLVMSEDSHVYFDITLAYLDKFTQPGDYLVVEDTHPNVHTRKNQGRIFIIFLFSKYKIEFM